MIVSFWSYNLTEFILVREIRLHEILSVVRDGGRKVRKRKTDPITPFLVSSFPLNHPLTIEHICFIIDKFLTFRLKTSGSSVFSPSILTPQSW